MGHSGQKVANFQFEFMNRTPLCPEIFLKTLQLMKFRIVFFFFFFKESINQYMLLKAYYGLGTRHRQPLPWLASSFEGKTDWARDRCLHKTHDSSQGKMKMASLN